MSESNQSITEPVSRHQKALIRKHPALAISPGKQTYSINETALLLDVSTKVISLWIAESILPSVKIGRSMRIPGAFLQGWITENILSLRR